jgi:hypothetical protein
MTKNTIYMRDSDKNVKEGKLYSITLLDSYMNNLV